MLMKCLTMESSFPQVTIHFSSGVGTGKEKPQITLLCGFLKNKCCNTDWCLPHPKHTGDIRVTGWSHCVYHHRLKQWVLAGPNGWTKQRKNCFYLSIWSVPVWSDALATFQRLMEQVLEDLRGKICMVYLDDIIIHSPSLQQHFHDIQAILDKPREAGLTVNMKNVSSSDLPSLFLAMWCLLMECRLIAKRH